MKTKARASSDEVPKLRSELERLSSQLEVQLCTIVFIQYQVIVLRSTACDTKKEFLQDSILH